MAMPVMPRTDELAASIRQLMESFFMRSMRDWTRYVKGTGLSIPQFGLMMRLFHGGSCGVHDVGEHFAITSAAASQLVEKLVQAGLVERAEDPDDRRARRLTLTEKGRSLVTESVEERYRWLRQLVDGLSPQERRALQKSLPAFRDLLQSAETRNTT